MTKEVRMKAREAKEDEEGWLREVIRMEEMTPSSPPASSPNQTAKMPTGKEPWRSMEDMSSVPDRMLGGREGVASKSKLAGATPSLAGSTNQVPPPGTAMPAERLSIIPAMVEYLAIAKSTVDVTTTIMKVHELPTKPRWSTRLSPQTFWT